MHLKNNRTLLIYHIRCKYFLYYQKLSELTCVQLFGVFTEKVVGDRQGFILSILDEIGVQRNSAASPRPLRESAQSPWVRLRACGVGSLRGGRRGARAREVPWLFIQPPLPLRSASFQIPVLCFPSNLRLYHFVTSHLSFCCTETR